MKNDNAIIVMEMLGWWQVWHETLNARRNITKAPYGAEEWEYKTQAMAYAKGLLDGIGKVEHGIIVLERDRSD